MNAEEARELTKDNNSNLGFTIARVEQLISLEIEKGNYQVILDHTKINNMSVDYWKGVIKHFKAEGYEVKPWCSNITFSW